MEVEIGDPQELSGQLTDRVVEAGSPLRMRVVVGPDEELVEASLVLVGRTDINAFADFSDPELSSDGQDSFQNISWVTADWGSSRSLADLALKLSAVPTNQNPAPTVLVKIARGGSGWFSPPGPHGFVVSSTGEVKIGFPDTVADRVMLELQTDKGAPVTRSLINPTGATTVLPLTFGQIARDPSVSLAGERPLFEYAGVLPLGDPGQGVEVTGLLDTLHERLGAPLRDVEFSLEIGAKAAGLLGVAWTLVSEQILEHFGADQQAEVEHELGWSIPWLIPLPMGEAVIHGLGVTIRWEPIRERIELAPQPDPAVAEREPEEPALDVGSKDAAVPDPQSQTEPDDLDSTRAGVAGLLRPRYQQAQGFTVTPTRPLLGVDLWVRAPADLQAVELTLELVADDGGRPGASILASATLGLPAGQTTVGTRPTWLRVDLLEPLSIDAERWWVVARVDAGELAWVSSLPERVGATRRGEVTGPCYRRDDGPWFTRDTREPDSWAMTRLRVLEPAAAPPPDLALVFGDKVYPLVVSPDDPTRFELHRDGPLDVTDPALRASSTVAGHLALSQLEVRWREGRDSEGS